MYDWGNSAFFTTIVSAVFPVYLFKVADSSLTGEETTAALMKTFSPHSARRP